MSDQPLEPTLTAVGLPMLRPAFVWPFALIVVAATALVFLGADGLKWPASHENARYLLLAEHMRDAWRHGVLWPRWLPDLYGGHGYPTFVFYQPLFFFLYQPFRWLIDHPILAMYVTVGFTLSLGGIASYLLGARRGSRLFGLFCAGLFLLTPYLYVNWLVRGDLSELLAMCLVPWTLFFLRQVDGRLSEGRPVAGSVAGLAVTNTLVLVAHPITALLLAPVLAVMALVMSLGRDRVSWRLLACVAFAGVVAALLGAPYWQPLVMMREHVQFERAFTDYFTATGHTVAWHQLLDGVWGHGGSTPHDTQDGMSFEVGKLQLVLALTAAVAGWKNRFTRAGLVALLLALFAMTPAATLLWTIPPFAQMQFPWRMLSVVAGLQIALAAGWADTLADRPSWRPPLQALAFTVVLALAWSPDYVTHRKTEPGAVTRDEIERVVGDRAQSSSLTSRNELLPRTVVKPPTKPAGPIVEGSADVGMQPLPGSDHYEIRWSIETAKPTLVRVNQFYLPGWQVELDGEPVPDDTLRAALRDDGRLMVALNGTGRHVLKARYAGPPGFALRLGMWLGGCVLLLGAFWQERRRSALQSSTSGFTSSS